MGYSTRSIPFWTDDIVIKEVISASRMSDFQNLDGKTLKSIGQKRLGWSRLEERIDNSGIMILSLRGGDFIEFIQG